jgi:HAD superfamily hydrolase (TIGR01509 family)
MTHHPATGEPLGQLVARTRYLLLDFDGPICDIFAGLPAPTVADHLRKVITSQGITPPDDIARSPDPIEVFTYSATVSPELAALVENEMADQELAAVATAKPTPYVHDVIASARQSGRPVAVVSNNAERAVRTYLTTHGLDDRIDFITARTSPDPALLKPSPYLLEQAVARARVPTSACLLVGDSITDIQAADEIDMLCIGYANKPGKESRLAQAGATAIITTLTDLVLTYRAQSLT